MGNHDHLNTFVFRKKHQGTSVSHKPSSSASTLSMQLQSMVSLEQRVF